METISRLGDYVLEREVGRGGMGVVYEARQTSLGRPVALKVLPQEFTADSMRLTRFRREAEVISRLDHPSIVPIYGVGEQEGVHYIAMKFVKGPSLDSLIRQRRPGRSPAPENGAGRTTAVLDLDTLGRPGDGAPSCDAPEGPRDPPALEMVRRPTFGASESDVGWVYRCLRIAERVARALHHAHTRGVIHRDVKPSNIMLDERGNPWLLDFGLVRDQSWGGESLTETGGLLGTAYYMAPEVIRGRHGLIDHRVDVYSLGVTLYEMVTLRRPFHQETPDTLFHAIVNEEPPRPRRVNPRLPRDLETVILKAMDKDPERRYESVEAFADDLRRVRSFEPIVARPVTFIGRARKWIHRNQGLAGALVFALLSFVGMVEYSIYRGLLDERRAAEALERAHDAYASGDYPTALRQYQLFVGLGGDEDLVSARLQELASRHPGEAGPGSPRPGDPGAGGDSDNR